uniref:Uncharacterized protein n=1 Tax=Romanomermis culicivorax TaxID=13658 RepID=A0A915IZM6_ROMCU
MNQRSENFEYETESDTADAKKFDYIEFRAKDAYFCDKYREASEQLKVHLCNQIFSPGCTVQSALCKKMGTGPNELKHQPENPMSANPKLMALKTPDGLKKFNNANKAFMRIFKRKKRFQENGEKL